MNSNEHIRRNLKRRITGMQAVYKSGHPGGNEKCQVAPQGKEYVIRSDPDDLYVRTRPLANPPTGIA